LINQTEDIDVADVMICQHNAAAGMRCNPVAWRVLQGIKRESAQAFELPSAFEVSIEDVTGHRTAPQLVEIGKSYEAAPSAAGTVLALADTPVENDGDVAIPNALKEGVIRADAYKDGRLVATRTNVDPGATASFRFMQHVYVGLASKVREGDVISDAVASRITTRLNLFGVLSADIVMTSSDNGARQPLFRLENIQC
jgi:hypothetical protein